MRKECSTSLVILLLLGVVQCRRAPDGGKTPNEGEIAAEPAVKQAPPMPAASSFRDVFTKVARHTVPSVVSIVSEKQTEAPRMPFGFFGESHPFEFFFNPHGQKPVPDAPEREFRQRGLGSGFIASREGYILTNNHVVDGADRLEIQFADERVFDAEVVGTDPETDLAVVKIAGKLPEGLTALELGDSEAVQIGEWVVAVGSPFGLYETVTTGIVSATGRQDTGISAYGNFLQTDAAINPGNSGGPLVNLEGRVVGINTAIFSQTGGYQGVGFAIPSNLAKRVMSQLVEDGAVTRGWIGVSIQPITPAIANAMNLTDRKGALVGDVVANGPAQKAGIQHGDVVRSIDGKEVGSVHALMNTVALLTPGKTVDIELLRAGKPLTLKVTIAKREPESASGKAKPPSGGANLSELGLAAEDLTTATRQRFGIDDQVKRGAVVSEVKPGSPADRSGLRPGDVILEANHKAVNSANGLETTLRENGKGRATLLLVQRGDSTSYVALQP
jgi:serine protease Do